MENIIKTKVMVKVVLTVSLTDNWGQDCKIEQIFKQSKTGAENWLTKLFLDVRDKVTIGEMKTVCIMTEEDKQ